jgi:hypothetical protein
LRKVGSVLLKEKAGLRVTVVRSGGTMHLGGVSIRILQKDFE